MKQRPGLPLRVERNFRSRISNGQGSQANTCGWKRGGSGDRFSSRRCQRGGEEGRRERKKKRADVVGATELGPVRGFTGQDRVRPRPA